MYGTSLGRFYILQNPPKIRRYLKKILLITPVPSVLAK
jgi:hypothetical protein